MRNWLANRIKGVEVMDEEVFEVPPVATIPLPEQQQSNGTALPSAVVLPMSEHLRHAATEAEKFEEEKARWLDLAGKYQDRMKDLARENEFLKLELAQAKNNMQTLQADLCRLQQENSDLRALQSELYALTMHVVARYEHNEISLPIRKRKKNGDKDNKSEQYVSKDDPRLNEIVGKT